MTYPEIEAVAITALIIAIPVLMIVSYWVYLINKEIYQEIRKYEEKINCNFEKGF